jgi:hypothetical protein
MVALFAVSYSLVLGRATPHHIQAGLVDGATRQRPDVVDSIERVTGGSVAFRPLASETQARTAMAEQRIYTALVPGPGGPRLLVASASGASVARLLVQVGQQVEPNIEVVDIHPLPPSDPQGLVSFYLTLAATIVGFVSMFQLRAVASELSLRAWLGFVVVLTVVGGLLLATVIGPIIGALQASFVELWAALSIEVAVAALVNSTMLVLFGRWAIIPTWSLFVILGNTSSGGAVSPPLLPAFYAFLGRYLPPGATVNILHGAAYFPHAQRITPFVVQGAWLLCSLAALLISIRLLRRLPTGESIESPSGIGRSVA